MIEPKASEIMPEVLRGCRGSEALGPCGWGNFKPAIVLAFPKRVEARCFNVLRVLFRRPQERIFG